MNHVWFGHDFKEFKQSGKANRIRFRFIDGRNYFFGICKLIPNNLYQDR